MTPLFGKPRNVNSYSFMKRVLPYGLPSLCVCVIISHVTLVRHVTITYPNTNHKELRMIYHPSRPIEAVDQAGSTDQHIIEKREKGGSKTLPHLCVVVRWYVVKISNT